VKVGDLVQYKKVFRGVGIILNLTISIGHQPKSCVTILWENGRILKELIEHIEIINEA